MYFNRTVVNCNGALTMQQRYSYKYQKKLVFYKRHVHQTVNGKRNDVQRQRKLT